MSRKICFVPDPWPPELPWSSVPVWQKLLLAAVPAVAVVVMVWI